MKIYIKNHDYIYELGNVCRLFLPHEKFEMISEVTDIEDFTEDYIYTEIEELSGERIKATVKINLTGIVKEKENIAFKDTDEHQIELLLSRTVYEILSEVTQIRPYWGIVTGIRPEKLFRRLINEGGEEYAINYFKNKLLVSEQKIDLCKETNKYEKRIIDTSKPESFSLYISIPFCPTRCSYCSFVSQSVERTKKLIPEYFELLLKEIEYTSKIAEQKGLRLETVYIGGGTPTTLDEQKIEKLIEKINRSFNMRTCREFTIEAGRPDTITYEKLKAMKRNGVTRISINPQTFNDTVLGVIGRKHSSEETLRAYSMAREIGFNNINMDIIAGLPTDTVKSFCSTIEKLFYLAPEGITVHTLSVKRAANMSDEQRAKVLSEGRRVSDMLSEVYRRFPEYGYHPYYFYRQSRMAGNMENTGWSKQGFDGLYNIYIMDETHTILSCGAGAVTKLKAPHGDHIERIFNYKFAYEYISGFKEIIDRKGKVNSFYEKV